MRVLSAAVFVLLVSICAFAGAGAGAENGVDGGIAWNIAGDGTLTISPAETPEEGYVSGEMKDYETPEETPWSASAGDLKKLVISDGVTKIGNSAFVGYEGFTGDLVIPDSVTTIGGWAFANCFGFSGSLVIGDNVTVIGEFAFINCSGFTGSVVIPASVTTIGDFAFNYCTGISVIYIAGAPALLIDKYPAEVPLAAVNGGIVKTFPAKPVFAVPEKAGYAFAGWYTNPDFSGDSSAAYEAGKIYYAKWETELPAPTQTGSSPAPVAGLLAGLGYAAALFSLRRK